MATPQIFLPDGKTNFMEAFGGAAGTDASETGFFLFGKEVYVIFGYRCGILYKTSRISNCRQYLGRHIAGAGHDPQRTARPGTMPKGRKPTPKIKTEPLRC